MKKVITLLLVAVMVMAMATTAFAANIGDTVTFTFKSNGNPGFASYNAEISYDSSALKLVEIKEGALTAGKGGFFLGEVSTGLTGYMATADVTGDGVLFTAVFEVLDAKAGDYAISAAIVPGSSSNAAGEAASFSITGGGSVEITCDHKWGEWEETKAPTCTEDGEMTRTCSECGKTETKAIDALGHTYGKWEVTKEATCKAKGEKTRVCEGCGHEDTQEIKKAEHKYKDGKCVWCGKKKPGTNKDNVPPTGDITPVVTMGVVAMISVVAAAAYVTKRRITK